MKIRYNYELIAIWHLCSGVYYEYADFEELCIYYTEMYSEYGAWLVGEAMLLHASCDKYKNMSQLHCVKITQRMVRRELSHGRKIADIVEDGIGYRERGKNYKRPSFIEDCNTLNLTQEKAYKGPVTHYLSNGKKVVSTKKTVYTTDVKAVNARQLAYNGKTDITIDKQSIALNLYEQSLMCYGSFCDNETSIIRKYLIADIIRSFGKKTLVSFNHVKLAWQEDRLDNADSHYKHLKYVLRDWNISVLNLLETYTVSYTA